MNYILRTQERLALNSLLRPSSRIQVVLLEGPPGCGKTAFTEYAASRLDAAYLYSLLHSWSDDQELFSGIDVAAAVEGDAAKVRQPGILAVAAEKSQHGKVLVCLDEVDKVQERTEYLLLDFLQTGRVPVRPGEQVQANVGNLVVALTSNNSRPLSDAMMRRCRRVRMTPLSAEAICEIAAEISGVSLGVVKLLCRAAWAVSQADGVTITPQELSHLATDCFHVAENHDDCREFVAQWAARGVQGATAARKADLAAAWGEIKASRRGLR